MGIPAPERTRPAEVVRTMLGRDMQSMAKTMRDFWPSESSPMRVVCILPVTP